METHWKKNFNYEYLGSYSLTGGNDMILTIKKTATEKVTGQNGKKEDCFVCYFNEQSKPMILNRTNCKILDKLYSPYVERWVGCKVQLYAVRVNAFGESVDALRFRDFKPVVKIDLTAHKVKLNTSKTLEELKTNYTSLSKEIQGNSEIIKLKEGLKIKLK